MKSERRAPALAGLLMLATALLAGAPDARAIHGGPEPGLPTKGKPLASPTAHRSAAPAYDASRLPFTVHFQANDPAVDSPLDSSWETMSAFVLPGSVLQVGASGSNASFQAEADAGELTKTGKREAGHGEWTWKAPAAHGNHEIRIRDTRSGKVAHLRVFVLHPFHGGDRIGNYRLGRYHPEAKDGNPAYRRPEGFVEVTEADLDVRLSPHFRLGQFVCKDESGWPKYVTLRSQLLVKLEALLDALARRGLPADTLHVMSGYRTPAYNAAIGNETTWSRHTYGDAADVFLDRDGDGMQDDLDGDGRVTREDARVIYRLVEDSLDLVLPQQLAGGLSAYGSTPEHGPFVHIDTRGKRARW